MGARRQGRAPQVLAAVGVPPAFPALCRGFLLALDLVSSVGNPVVQYGEKRGRAALRDLKRQWQNKGDQSSIPPSLPHWLPIKSGGHPESHLQDQHLPYPQQFSANFNPCPIKRITKFHFTLFLILLFALLCSNCKDQSWLLQNPR